MDARPAPVIRRAVGALVLVAAAGCAAAAAATTSAAAPGAPTATPTTLADGWSVVTLDARTGETTGVFGGAIGSAVPEQFTFAHTYLAQLFRIAADPDLEVQAVVIDDGTRVDSAVSLAPRTPGATPVLLLVAAGLSLLAAAVGWTRRATTTAGAATAAVAVAASAALALGLALLGAGSPLAWAAAGLAGLGALAHRTTRPRPVIRCAPRSTLLP